MTISKRWGALLLVMVLILCLLSGCGSNSQHKENTTTPAILETTPEISLAPSNEVNASEPISAVTSDIINDLSDEQKNSLNMLNYLAYITQEILSKKNNRIYIEQVYSSLINDINPSTVNDITEAHFDEMLDRLHEFEKLLTKRERLQYLFEQNQAQAMRNAIPNPIGLLSAVSSMNIASLVSSVVYMAVDSVSSYTSGMQAAEQTFLQSSWELNDDESDTIHSLRKQTFMYMVEIVKEYSLKDKLALKENSIDKLVEWKEKKPEEASAASRVHFYKTYESEYEGFGQYWLARAIAHYDNNEFDECLKAIQRYEDLSVGIFRQDYELAKVLPVAISAANQIYNDKIYVDIAGYYADLIISNANIKNDWALRYFAAQTYIDLCARTQDKSYLKKAFDIALENVNELKAEQKKLNTEYISDLKLEEIPEGTSDEKKKLIEAYNKQKQLDRDIALPPVYHPLKLNLDLLYALTEQLDISETELKKMEDIVYIGDQPLFLNIPMNEQYRVNDKNSTLDINFTGKDILIPVILLTDEAKVSITIHEDIGNTVIVDDWSISKVERKEKSDVSSFIATYHSKTMESYDFKKALNLSIKVEFDGTSKEKVYTYNYTVKNSKEWVFFNKTEFEDAE